MVASGDCGMHALETLNISKHFGGVRALDDVSLKFERGEVVGIIGGNGAGKSTLLEVVAGTTTPDAGRVVLYGEDVTRLSPASRFRRGFARTFQRTRLALQLTVFENLELAMLPEGVECWWRLGVRRPLIPSAVESQGRSVLQDLGLDGVRDVACAALSYGQKRMVSLACVVAAGSRVAFLDEPVAALDSGMARTVLASLRRMASHGASVVFIEHDVGFVSEAADRAIVMQDGQIIDDGRPECVLKGRAFESAYGS